ncbi:MAG: response regulator [Chloroflexota bacterium]|nr:response regulator [Chloroflexota bacterium]
MNNPQKPVILFVDDELHRTMKPFLDRIKSKFKQYEIVCPLTLEKAKQDFVTHRERIQLIILDIQLAGSNDDPDIAGLDLARFVRLKSNSNVPIIVYTNLIRDDVARKFQEINVDEIMRKQGKGEQLAHKVQTLLAIYHATRS